MNCSVRKRSHHKTNLFPELFGACDGLEQVLTGLDVDAAVFDDVCEGARMMKIQPEQKPNVSKASGENSASSSESIISDS